MACPARLQMGRVGLQIWRLAANILNKQSWTVDQEWSSSLGVWHEVNNLTLVQKQHRRASELDG
jgi:hypothetical protein